MRTSEVLYLGAVTPGAFVHSGERFRVALRDVPGTFGAVYLAAFDARVKKFIEQLPTGSGEVAYALPPAATDLEQGVAVVDVKVLSRIPFGLTAAEFVRRLEQAVAGCEVFRLTGPFPAQTLDVGQQERLAELAVAVAGDKALDYAASQDSLLGQAKEKVKDLVNAPGDWFEKLREALKDAGKWALVVLFALIALGVLYLLSKRRREGAPSV